MECFLVATGGVLTSTSFGLAVLYPTLDQIPRALRSGVRKITRSSPITRRSILQVVAGLRSNSAVPSHWHWWSLCLSERRRLLSGKRILGSFTDEQIRTAVSTRELSETHSIIASTNQGMCYRAAVSKIPSRLAN